MRPASLFLCAAALTALPTTPLGDKIVWLPLAGAVSHQMLAVKVGRELTSRGHELTIINSDHATGKSIYDRVQSDGVRVLKFPFPMTREDHNELASSLPTLDPLAGVTELIKLDVDCCVKMIEDEAIVKELESADTIVVDVTSRCGSAIREKYNIKTRVDFLPVTFFDPFYMPRLGGINNPSFIPQMGSRLTPNMDLGQRIHNAIVTGVNYLVVAFIADPKSDELREKLGVTVSHKESVGDVGMFIMQTSWAVEFPRAVPPAVRFVGPILSHPGKALPEEFSKFVEGATDGVVLVSFGSQAILSQERVNTLTAALGKLKQRVIFKSPGLKPSSVPDNVMMVDWVPQNDLLAHPKLIAFVSHGGLNGVSEAAYHGVPVIGVPLFGDQWDNIARLEYRNMAIAVDSDSYTADSMAETIIEVVSNQEYASNAKKVSAIIKDTPKPPVELAADAIEYAIRHDGAMLHRIKSLDMPWWAVEGYDVMLALLFFLVILPYYGLKMCCRKLCGGGTKAKKE